MALKAMGGGAAGSDDDTAATEIMAEINITPLTDVFLVLLIIFMVTSSVMSQLGVDVQLPKAGAAATKTEEARPVLITMLSDGSVSVNGTKTTFSRVEPELRRAFEAGSSRTVVLEGDKKAFLGAAVEVMDLAKKAGAEKFAIATAPGSEGR